MSDQQISNNPSGNAFRVKVLEAPASEVGLKPSGSFPRVYGVVMDWNVSDKISSTIALCDGNASIYGPAVNISDNLKSKRVRDAATNLVLDAGIHHDDAVATNDYSYPRLGGVRFYLLCFDGVRVIESTEAALGSGKDNSASLWKAAQVLIFEMHSDKQSSAEASNVIKSFFKKKNWIDLLVISALLILLSYRFISRTFLGASAWLTSDDAGRTPINGIVHFVVDENTWLLIPVILFIGFTFPSHWNKHGRSR